jgi:hypothetical protein
MVLGYNSQWAPIGSYFHGFLDLPSEGSVLPVPASDCADHKVVRLPCYAIRGCAPSRLDSVLAPSPCAGEEATRKHVDGAVEPKCWWRIVEWQPSCGVAGVLGSATDKIFEQVAKLFSFVFVGVTIGVDASDSVREHVTRPRTRGLGVGGHPGSKQLDLIRRHTSICDNAFRDAEQFVNGSIDAAGQIEPLVRLTMLIELAI